MEFTTALAFTWIELTFLCVFFLLMILGTAYDRRGSESLKWYIFGAGFIVIAIYYWSSVSFLSFWTFLSSWAFWKPITIYFAIGLAYSMIEFALNVRRSARQYAKEWQKHLNTRIDVQVVGDDGIGKMVEVTAMVRGEVTIMTNGEGQPMMKPDCRNTTRAEDYAIVKEKGAVSARFNEVNEQTKGFILASRFEDRIVEIQLAENKIGIEPRVNRRKLADHIGAWTFFWPAYLVSLIIGDLMTEVFRVVADFLASISGRFVKLSFANVFKF